MATTLIKSVYTTLWTSDHSICHIQQNLQNSPNKATMVFMKSNIWSLTQRRQNIDHLFQSLVLPKISYGLPVYASSVSELNIVQEFLRRCLKRRFISYTIDIYYFLEKKKKKRDKSISKKISCPPTYPLYNLLPTIKESSKRLRTQTSLLPCVNTQLFKASFINRLYFKYTFTI